MRNTFVEKKTVKLNRCSTLLQIYSLKTVVSINLNLHDLSPLNEKNIYIYLFEKSDLDLKMLETNLIHPLGLFAKKNCILKCIPNRLLLPVLPKLFDSGHYTVFIENFPAPPEA